MSRSGVLASLCPGPRLEATSNDPVHHLTSGGNRPHHIEFPPSHDRLPPYWRTGMSKDSRGLRRSNSQGAGRDGLRARAAPSSPSEPGPVAVAGRRRPWQGVCMEGRGITRWSMKKKTQFPQPAGRRMTPGCVEAEPVQNAKKGRLYGGHFGEKAMIVIWRAVLAINNRAWKAHLAVSWGQALSHHITSTAQCAARGEST